MTLRRLYAAVFAIFAVILTAIGGWLAFSVARQSLETELDDKLLVAAGVAAEIGLGNSDLLLLVRPGDEEEDTWRSYQERLRSLVEQRYVDAAWIFRTAAAGDAGAPPVYRAVVSSSPVDSVPIGHRIFIFDAHGPALEDLWQNGSATTSLFRGLGARYYKYGFVRLDESDPDADLALAVLMPAEYLAPLARLQRTVLITSGITIVFSLVVAVALAARVAEPLERLSRTALRIQRGRIRQPVEMEAGMEIGRLARAMERMRQGVIQRDEHLRLMLAQVAHEIRNPLGGLKLFAAIAQESTDAEERTRLVRRIQDEVDGLNRIITDFLMYARPIALDVKLHDMRIPLREAGDLVANEVELKGGQLELDLPDREIEAIADPEQVKRMVINLLRNAADAGDRIRLGAEWMKGEVVVSVRDNGPGVPDLMRERIFEPFVTTKGKGAGLGLAIVADVAKANNTRVELVENRDGATGAEFRLYFPGSEELRVGRVTRS